MPEYPTSIGTSDPTTIRLLGHDLAAELLGQVGFGELAFWLAARRRPSAGEVRLFEAVLVSLTDHGFTPTAIAARLTYYSAPDSVQGALAAGILGGGSRFLGVTEDTGRWLHRVLDGLGERFDEQRSDEQRSDEQWDAVALDAVRTARAAGEKIPGLGHPVHKQADPRVPVMFAIAEDSGCLGDHLRLFAAVGRVHEQVLGRRLPLNGAGVAGAALADLGLPIDLLRAFALLARTAGLIGHLAEEQITPIGPTVYVEVDRNAVYTPLPDDPDRA
ncbi:MAG TPA: citryl-CoA lyase [Friedmanniella sp.]